MTFDPEFQCHSIDSFHVFLPVQVILMSATVDSFAYTRYFASRTPRGVELAPAISVQGRTYRVIDFCLDDIKHVGEVCEVFMKIMGTCFKLGKMGGG